MVSFINLNCILYSSTLIESWFAGSNVNTRDLQGTRNEQEIGFAKLPEEIQSFLSTGKWVSFLGLDNGSRMR